MFFKLAVGAERKASLRAVMRSAEYREEQKESYADITVRHLYSSSHLLTKIVNKQACQVRFSKIIHTALANRSLEP